MVTDSIALTMHEIHSAVQLQITNRLYWPEKSLIEWNEGFCSRHFPSIYPSCVNPSCWCRSVCVSFDESVTRMHGCLGTPGAFAIAHRDPRQTSTAWRRLPVAAWDIESLCNVIRLGCLFVHLFSMLQNILCALSLLIIMYIFVDEEVQGQILIIAKATSCLRTWAIIRRSR